MLPGIMGGIHAGIEAESVTIDASPEIQDTLGDTVWTFSIDIGTARANRRIFLPIHWVEGGSHETLSTVTINGVSATIQQEGHSGGATGFGCAIAQALVPSGTGSVNAVLTFSGDTSGVALTTIRTVGLTGTSAHDTDVATSSVTATDLTDTTNIPSNGLLIVVYTGSTNTQNVAVTWTGATEIYDLQGPTIVGDAVRCSLAVSSGLAVQTGRTITADIVNTADSGNAFVIQSWT